MIQKFAKLLILWNILCCVEIRANDLVVSRIDHQEMYIGSRSVIYFSTLAYVDTAEIMSAKLPSFGTIINDGHGSGHLIFDAGADNLGIYNIDLTVLSNGYTNTQQFTLEVLPLPQEAHIYYADPLHGNDDNPGTIENPWKTLGKILSENTRKIEPGSFVFLKSGYHGSLNFWGQNDKKITVMAQSHQSPTAKNFTFSFTNNWHVSGLEISPQANNELNNLPLALIYGGCSQISISNCYLYSFKDQARWSSNQEWYAYSGNGIISTGNDCVFKGNLLRNTWFSTELKADNQVFSYNIIDGFGADAMRGLADNLKFEYNQVKNSLVYDYDDPVRPQHDDLFQSWTFSQPRKNFIIRGNQLTDYSNPNLRLPSEITQGIVDFDGFAEDWVIENNLVVVHHAHGISLYGAKNCKIINNTVTKNPFQKFNPTHLPWIRINPTKPTADGKPSESNLVQNNITHSYQTDNLEPATLKSNLIGYIQNTTFANYDKWIFSLKSTSQAFQTGQWEDAPKIEIQNSKRSNATIDMGCFEHNSTKHNDIKPIYSPIISVFEIGITHLKLRFSAIEDDKYLQHYKIRYNDQSVISTDTDVTLYNLEPSTFYTITVTAVDIFNLESDVVNTFATLTIDYDIHGENVIFIVAESQDQEINSNKNPMWGYSEKLRLGYFASNYTQCAIIPFNYPSIPPTLKIVGADFISYFETKTNITTQKVDLYGLTDLIPLAYYYYYYEGQSFNDDRNVLIKSSFCSNNSGEKSFINLDTGAKSILLNYLNNLIKNGLALGDKLIFRLNVNEKLSQKNTYFSLASADSHLTYNRPVLKLILNDKTTANHEVNVDDDFQIFPNPIKGNELNLKIDASKIKGDIHIYIHSNDGKLIDVRWLKTVKDNEMVDLSHLKLISGLYHVTIIGNGSHGSKTFIIP